MNRLYFLNQREIAEALRVSKNTVTAWTREGLPCIPGWWCLWTFRRRPVLAAVEIDNAELQAGKSPHSGFGPESPTPMKAFDGLSKPYRPHGMRKQ